MVGWLAGADKADQEDLGLNSRSAVTFMQRDLGPVMNSVSILPHRALGRIKWGEPTYAACVVPTF